MTLIFNRSQFKERRRELRRKMTSSEHRLWKYLRPGLEGFKFRRQYGINAYVVDFYCPKKRLVIEVDGSAHDSPAAKEYDKVRQGEIEVLGIRFLRFTNREVMHNLDSVLSKIRAAMKNL